MQESARNHQESRMSASKTELVLPANVETLRTLSPRPRHAFVSGNFSVLHPGHVRLLRFAAESADRLVVAVNPDGTPGAFGPQEDRLAAVRSLSMIDEAFVLDAPLPDVLRRLRPDVVIKGKEYETRLNAERAVVESYGGKLLFSSGEMRYSPQAVLQGSELGFSTIRKPEEYPKRHNFDPSELKSALNLFAGLRVLVLGDLIVDTYINCDPLGMSQEDPTLVVTPVEESSFIGGAGIVAAHANGMGAQVQFISVIGADKEGSFARETLAGLGVEAHLFVDTTRPTTLKRRYRAKGKTLLRVNQLRQHAVEHDLIAALLEAAESYLPDIDLLLFSDFNYGCLPQALVDPLMAMARERGVVMAADSQASSQLADISRFRGMDLITPTEREARLALQDFESGLVIVAEKLQRKAQAKHVLITLGEEGLMAFGPDLEAGEYRTDLLPAFNVSPRDVAGAGDSLFTTTALALRAGVNFWQSTYLGALAAACQVSRVGNTPLMCSDLEAEIDWMDS
jgi:rfaE bifunctional protein kinase chain/domain